MCVLFVVHVTCICRQFPIKVLKIPFTFLETAWLYTYVFIHDGGIIGGRGYFHIGIGRKKCSLGNEILMFNMRICEYYIPLII